MARDRTPVDLARRIVASGWFQHGVTGAILVNALVIALETWPPIYAEFGASLELANRFFLGVFIVEAAVKIFAHYPRMHGYFKDGWNVFDFSIIVVSLLPSTGELATVARLARVLRVLRLISTLPELRLIVSTLIRSIPSMFNVMALMSIIFFVYAVAGYHLFHDVDPEHWRHLGIALLSLFRIVTLEDWTDIMYVAMELHPMAWLFFVSFVMLAAVIMINLVIAVVINNLHDARLEVRPARGDESEDEATLRTVREEAANARAALERVETILAKLKK